MKKNILYCGMADDILTPILLVPDFNTIFAIDSFDMAFARDRSWEGQKDDILQMLSLGSDALSHHREVLLKYQKDVPVVTLKERCKLIDWSDDGGVFRVKFSYLGKTRILLYYHHRNFFTEWPKKVKNISHLMSMGAAFAFSNETANVSYTRWEESDGMFGPRVEDSEVCITRMLSERTKKNCLYYTNEEFNITRTRINCPRKTAVFSYELSDIKTANLKRINLY